MYLGPSGLVPIKTLEAHCKLRMRGYDDLPRPMRDIIKEKG